MYPETKVNRGLYNLPLSRQEMAGNRCIQVRKGKTFRQTVLPLLKCRK